MIEKFKIGYFADGIWAHNTFELLIKDPNIEVKFICARFGSTDLKFNDYADKYGIDFLKHKNINLLKFLNKIKVYN